MKLNQLSHNQDKVSLHAPILKLVCPCYRTSHARDDVRLYTFNQPLHNFIPIFTATREELIPNHYVEFVKSGYSRLNPETDLFSHTSAKMAAPPQRPTHDSRLAFRLWMVVSGTVVVLLLLSSYYTGILRTPLDYAESKAGDFCRK